MTNKITFYKRLMALAFACGALLTACVQEDVMTPLAGEAKVRIELNAGSQFEQGTKAVDEDSYKDLHKYTVQILKDGKVYKEHNYQYANVPETITLPIAAYTLKAFCGTDSNYSRTGFYVEGTTNFSPQTDSNVKTVSVTCEPVVGKLVTKFDTKMSDYFSDYKVVYTTSSITGEAVTWAKNDSDPWYIKVAKGGETVTAKIILTPKAEYDSKQTVKEVTKSYKLEPNKAWTLEVAPNYTATNGKLGISITIDDTTVDHPIDIVVPSDWL